MCPSYMPMWPILYANVPFIYAYAPSCLCIYVLIRPHAYVPTRLRVKKMLVLCILFITYINRLTTTKVDSTYFWVVNQQCNDFFNAISIPQVGYLTKYYDNG